MRTRILSLLSLALLAAPFTLPQDKAAFPLESIKIRGNDQIPTERILAATGLKIGAPITRPEFNEARDRLLATGAFESVGFNYTGSANNTGFDATFTVVEVQPLYRYRFEALPAPESQLRDALRKQESIFGDAIPPSPQVMNRYSMALAKAIGNGVQVIGEVNSDEPGELQIVFRPLGGRMNISEVNFRGNTVLPNMELWRIINPVAIGVPYSEPLFRQMLDSSVRAAYEDRGRVRIAFTKIETAKSSDVEGLDVTVTIDEGQPYKLGEVDIKGVEAKEVSDLNKLANWGKDATFSQADVNTALGRIKKSFREDGYLRVDTPFTRVIHDDTKTVDLVVTIQPGPLFQMGKLTIKGLDILTEPYIRKLWKLNEGDSYHEAYPDQFLAMLRAEDYFDNLARTGAEADLHEDTHKVDVTLTFLGAKAAAELDKKKPR